MDIEQRPPNGPNFGLVVILAGVVLLVLFVVAYFTLDWDGKRLVPHHFAKHATSELVMPANSGKIEDQQQEIQEGFLL